MCSQVLRQRAPRVLPRDTWPWAHARPCPPSSKVPPHTQVSGASGTPSSFCHQQKASAFRPPLPPQILVTSLPDDTAPGAPLASHLLSVAGAPDGHRCLSFPAVAFLQVFGGHARLPQGLLPQLPRPPWGHGASPGASPSAHVMQPEHGPPSYQHRHSLKDCPRLLVAPTLGQPPAPGP